MELLITPGILTSYIHLHFPAIHTNLFPSFSEKVTTIYTTNLPQLHTTPALNLHLILYLIFFFLRKSSDPFTRYRSYKSFMSKCTLFFKLVPLFNGRATFSYT
jgi:hypothetical protein